MSAHAERPLRRPGWPHRVWHGLWGAVAFLTLVPVPPRVLGDRVDVADAVAWFPLVGAAVGAVAGALRLGLAPLIGRGPSSALALAALVVLTGALHQDGLADTCDGLGVRGDRARRLAVMRESTVGAFGVLGLVLWALLLFSALDGLSAAQGLRALVAAGAAGRLAAVGHAVATRPARRDGLGAGMRVSGPALALAVLLAAAVAVADAGALRGGLSLALAGAMAVLGAALARRAFGGHTGDTLGATVALTEVAVCLALLATWR